MATVRIPTCRIVSLVPRPRCYPGIGSAGKGAAPMRSILAAFLEFTAGSRSRRLKSPKTDVLLAELRRGGGARGGRQANAGRCRLFALRLLPRGDLSASPFFRPRQPSRMLSASAVNALGGVASLLLRPGISNDHTLPPSGVARGALGRDI